MFDAIQDRNDEVLNYNESWIILSLKPFRRKTEGCLFKFLTAAMVPYNVLECI